MLGQDPPIQRRLLPDMQLTFEKAADIALAMETAAHNAETMGERVGQGR